MTSMRISDGHLLELAEQGYTIIEGFVAGTELAEAQDAVWTHAPRPEEYFADPADHAEYARSQFAGNVTGPFDTWPLNRLTFHPDLVDAVARFLGSDDLHLYKTELWVKYAGAVDYDQPHHHDYGNHSLLVPKRSDPARQVTTFLLLSDVTEEDGPTKVVPLDVSNEFPYVPGHDTGTGADWNVATVDPRLFEAEVSVVGPAGTLFMYRTDILHRGSQITGEGRSRVVLLSDYQVWGDRWTGKLAWPNHTNRQGWNETMVRATPRERALFGFPMPGHSYWDDQTITDVGRRYPGMDMAPYRHALDRTVG